MANDLTTQVWYIDTVQSAPTPGQINYGPCHIKSLNWSKMTSGDSLTCLDRNGKVVYDLTASATNENINLPNLGWTMGFYVSVLGSGNVQVSVNK